MATGILAHLGRQLSNQQELLATEGLTYLLRTSEDCSDVIRSLARLAGQTLPTGIHYRSEVSGAELDRPDIVGIDDSNVEVSIIEGKFYAGLTHNQPSQYLTRLKCSPRGLLLFVVPSLRVARLWEELLTRAANDEFTLAQEATTETGLRWGILNTGHGFMIISWSDLLGRMQGRVGTGNVAADIRQLRQYCEMIEETAFRPFSSEELSSIEHPRRHRDLCNLVDGITAKLNDQGNLSLEGMRATSVRNGYTRYVWLGGNRGVGSGAIGLDYWGWGKYQFGPLFVGCAINPPDTKLEEAFKSIDTTENPTPRMYEYLSHQCLPLPIRPILEHDEIVDETAKFINKIIGKYHELT